MYDVLKCIATVSIVCCLVVLLPLEDGRFALHAGEKDVLDNALHWETIAASKRFRHHLFSSYDRTGGNVDFGNYYGEESDGWKILADIEGAGCMVRFWATRWPASDDWWIRIYIDNLDEPLLEVPFQDLFGNVPPFVPPLADSTTGAWCCYLPVLFREHFRVAWGLPDARPIFYQINVIEFDDDIGVNSFTMPPNSEYQEKLDSLSLLFQTAHEPPWTPADSIRRDTSLTIASDSTVEIVNIPGEGTVFRFEIEGFPLSWEVARALILRITYDNQSFPRIEAPLGDLIAMGYSNEDIRAIGFSLQGNRIGFYFPMPFERGTRFELMNSSASDVPVQVAVSWTPTEISTTRLCAASNVADTLGLRVPVTLMDVDVPGHFVACMLTTEGLDVGTLLEGDEYIQYDSNPELSLNGTGADDYFDCGYYFGGPQGAGIISEAYFGIPHYQRNSPYGRNAAYRIHALDYVAFRDNLIFTQEHGGYSEAQATYRSVLLYYAHLGKWSFEDANGDGELYPGESFEVHGWLLQPNSPLEFSLGDVTLTDLAGQTTPMGTFEATGICPQMPNGSYLLHVSDGVEVDTIETDMLVDSDLCLTVTNVRGEPVLFPYDTLELSAFPVLSLNGAAAYCNELLVEWLPGTLILDSLFVLRGRIQVPVALPDGLVIIKLQTGEGNVQDTLSLSRQISWEMERSVPPVSWLPYFRSWWNPIYSGSLAVRLEATAVRDSVVFAVPLSPPGEFSICFYVGKGPNRGVMDVLWDDSVRVAGYDCYNSHYVRSDSINLGTIDNEGGTHTLTFRVMGRNSNSSDYWLAADQLVFTGLTHSSTEPDLGAYLPDVSFLEPCYPNPFNSVAVFRYGLCKPARARIDVYNILGQRVMTLVDRHHIAGIYRVKMDASHLASGLYFCRLHAGAFYQTQKLLLLR